jgi:hypothetical protein
MVSEQERQAAVAKACWDWRAAATGAAARAATRSRRVKSLVGAGVGAVAAAWFFARGHHGLAVVPAVFALVGLFMGTVAPAALVARWHGGVDAFSAFTGRAFAWVVLTPVYLLFFWPFGLVRRLRGHDALQMRGPSRPSYWVAHPAPTSTERTF